VKFNKQLTKSVFKKYIFLLAFAFLAAAGVIGYGAYKNQQIAQASNCDSNNIVYCGVNSSNLYSAYNALDGVGRSAYNHAGVQSSKFNQLTACVIYRDGTVRVGGQVVATGAVTYGRMNITRNGQGSTQIPGGAWMRPPSVSFADGVNSIASYCYMEGQEFKWGIIGECGNPIKATPTKKNTPKGTITKTVSKPVVNVGEVFTYTITVKNVGNVALSNVVLKDLLPPGIVMANGINENPRVFLLGTMQPGETKVIRLLVKADPSVVRNVDLRNLACFSSDYIQQHLPVLCDDAFVQVRDDKTPDIKIEKDVSAAEPVEVGEPFTYTIKVTNTGETFLHNVRVTDTLPAGVVPVNNPNAHTVSFVVSGLRKGASETFRFQAKVVTGPDHDVALVNTACVETDEIRNKKCDDADIHVKQPIYTCNSLEALKLTDTRYRFTTSYTAQNGAVLKNIAYNFGDGTAVVNTTQTTVEHQYAAAGTYNTKAVLTFTVKGQDKVVEVPACAKQVTVSVPQPVYTCNSLTAAKLTNTQYRFTVAYTAQNGAVLKNIAYSFGDNTSAVNTTQTTVDHTYPANTTDSNAVYQAKAVLTFTVNGQDKVVDVPACAKQITVPPEVKQPIYTCDGLVINKLSDTQYRFTVAYTAQNGAVLKNIAYNFGDQSEVLNTLQTTVDHTYAVAGEYNAAAVLTFTVNGQDQVVASDNCKASTDKPPVIPKCPIPGKEHLPKDSPDCVETPPVTPPQTPTPPAETPTSIPDTGAGQVIGMFLSTVAAGMVAYQFVWLRKYQ
jgi:uncharacterized repeat protein (TIGR01451 family)